MATSRDDFVIAIRSAFLKKSNKQRFSLLFLIFLSIVLIFLTSINFTPINYIKTSVNEVIYRISFIVSIPEKQLSRSIFTINEHFKMYEDYKLTKENIKKLEIEKYNTGFLISENQRLRKLIDEYIINSEELVGKVLLDKESPFLKSIIINKGSKDKVELGMAVLDKSYLVGKIVEVNYSTSRALLISDLNSKIPVTIEPGNYQSILSGTGKEFGQIQYFKKDAILDKKSIVYTSGSGGVFKAGIPIGIIKQESSNTEKTVNFFSDLSQLTFVKLISYKKEEK